MVKFDIQSQGSPSSLLRECQEAFGHERVNRSIGQSVQQTVKQWLGDYDALVPNRLGGRRTHFAEDAGRNTNVREASDGVDVVVNKLGIRQRYYGGDIRPGVGTSSATGKPTRLLAIAACAEAYGHSPSEFSNLHAIFFRGSRATGALVEGAPGEDRKVQVGTTKSGRKKNAAFQEPGRIMFWLIAKATQRGVPGILPNDATIRESIHRAVSLLAERIGK